jgi:hypothetical protein
MATQRKIFRIEETEQGFAPDAEADLGLATQDEILTEIRALRALVETRTARRRRRRCASSRSNST